LKLTVKDAVEVLAGLKALDGFEKVAKVGAGEKTTDRVVVEAYKFKPAAMWKLAKNTAALKGLVENYGKVRNKLIKDISGGKDEIAEKDNPDFKAQQAKFMEDISVIVDTEEEVMIDKLAQSDLNLDVNSNIPPSVLVSLLPIMDVK